MRHPARCSTTVLTCLCLLLAVGRSLAVEGEWELVHTEEHGGYFEIFMDAHLVDAQTGWAVGTGGHILHTADGATWEEQDSGTGHQLSSVHAEDAQTAWIVGAYGTILHTADGGGAWTGQTSGTGAHLNAVEFQGTQEGWAIGISGTVLHTADGGTTWEQQTSNTTANLNGLDFVDAQVGWAVGSDGLLLHTVDGGATWTSQTIVDEHLMDVSFADSQSGLIAGHSGRILTTHDGGATWSTYYPGGITHRGCFMLDDQRGWVVGNSGELIHTADGGATWAGQTHPEYPGHSTFRSVFFVDGNVGVVAGARGTVLYSSNGGVLWERQTPQPLDRTLVAVDFGDADKGWAVGRDGIVLHSADAGASWIPQPIPVETDLTAVDFVDGQAGWAVGEQGTILGTGDAGSSWQQQVAGTISYLTDVVFVDSQVGWAVGQWGQILHTEDGGANWLLQSSGVGEYLGHVEFLDANTGWVVGDNGTILATTDGGATWTPQVSGTGYHLWGVDFADSQRGWAVGAVGTILSTSNGGLTWSQQVSNTNQHLPYVEFVGGQTGWIAGFAGLIFHTDDGGVSWRYDSTPGRAFLGARFQSATSGWAVGGTDYGPPDGLIYEFTGITDAPTLDLIIHQIGIPQGAYPLVKAYASVVDETGAPIVGLSSTEFAISQDYVSGEQVIPVSSAGVPLSMAWLLDYGDAMSAQDLTDMEGAVSARVDALDPADQGAVVRYASSVEVGQALTSDPALLQQAIAAGYSGDVALRCAYDAVHQAASLFGDETGRKAMVLITSGPAEGCARSREEALYYALFHQVAVFVVTRTDDAELQSLAAATRGRYYAVAGVGEFDAALTQIAAVLAQSYQITYSTGHAQNGERHTTRMTCTYDGSTAEDQAGYWVPRPLESAPWAWHLGPDPAGSRHQPTPTQELLPDPFGLKWETPVAGAEALVGQHHLDSDQVFVALRTPDDEVLRIDPVNPTTWYTYPASATRLGAIVDANGDRFSEAALGTSRPGTAGDLELSFYYYAERFQQAHKPGGADSRGWPVALLSDRFIGLFDAAASGYPRGVSAFDRLSGHELWHYSVGPRCEVWSLADIDADGEVEVAISCTSTDDGVTGDGWQGNGTPTSDAEMYTIVIDEDGEEHVTVDYRMDGQESGMVANLLTDLDHDGSWEILALEGHHAEQPGIAQIHLIDPTTGSFTQTHHGPQDAGWSLPVIADLDGDGQDEVVVSGRPSGQTDYSGQYALDAALSPAAQTTDAGQVRFANDLDGDGQVEVGLTDGSTLRVLDGSLNEEWRFVAQGEITAAIVADTDLNGRMEVLCLADQLHVLEGGITGHNVAINHISPAGFPVIKVLATVTDHDDQPVLGLQVDDFTITEDQVTPDDIQVRPADESGDPISAALVLDYSSSMTSTAPTMETAAQQFIGLMQAGDRGAVIKFSTGVSVSQEPVADPALLSQAVETAFAGAGGATSFYDAIVESAGLMRDESGRRAIVIITDADDNSSTHTQQGAVDSARAAGAPVFAVGLGSLDQAVLVAVAQQTGGHAYFPLDASTLVEVYTTISNTLRNQYEISYTTPNLSEARVPRVVAIQATSNSLIGRDTATYLRPPPPGPPEYTVRLSPGWNLISLGEASADGSIADLTAPIQAHLIRVIGFETHEYNPNPPEIGGKLYDPELLEVVNTLDLTDYHLGYWVKMSAPDVLTVGGEAAKTAPLTAKASAGLHPVYDFMGIHGQLRVEGEPAPVGTVVEVIDGEGTLAGRCAVRHAGFYGFLPIYRDDARTEEDEGADTGEWLNILVNGQPTSSPVQWTEFGDVVELDVESPSSTGSPLPTAFALRPNFPNPFNPGTTISYELPRDEEVVIYVYSLTGQVIRELARTTQPAGYYSVRWDGRDAGGTPVANGVYLYGLRAGDYHSVGKMVLVK